MIVLVYMRKIEDWGERGCINTTVKWCGRGRVIRQDMVPHVKVLIMQNYILKK